MKRSLSFFIVLTLLISQLISSVLPAQATPGDYTSPGLTLTFPPFAVGPNSSMTMYGFMPTDSSDPVGKEYTVTIETATKPLMVVGTSDVSSWSYDETTDLLTVTAASVSTLNPMDGSEYEKFVGISFGDPGSNGPGATAQGMYIATNSTNWSMQPGDDVDGDKIPDTIALQIAGKAGASGFFEMFWPTALLESMNLTAAKLVGYIDGDRVSTTVTEVAGGAVIRFNLKYNAGGTSAGLRKSAGTKTLGVSTGQAQTISLNADKGSIKKKNTVKLYGWVSPKKKNAKVDLYRKYKGEKKFKKIATVRSTASGSYKRSDKPKKTATYKAYYKIGKKTYASSTEVVSVK